MGNEGNKNLNYEKDYAFRIYKIFNYSPLKGLKIKELSDFIIPPKELFNKNISFKVWLEKNRKKKISIKIYSLLNRQMRDIEITINNDECIDVPLGCAVNFENYKTAERKLLHVLKVQKQSFSQENLFLIENLDYIIGLKPVNDDKYYVVNNDKIEDLIVGFIDIINKNKGKNCEFFIYNTKQGSKIVTTKIPDDSHFSLGCNVAYGKIHEFPIKIKEEDDEKRSLKD